MDPFNPQTAGGWGPIGQSKIKSPIDLKPGCKLKFVRCLETYIKKIGSLDHEGTLEDLFYQWSPEKKD